MKFEATSRFIISTSAEINNYDIKTRRLTL